MKTISNGITHLSLLIMIVVIGIGGLLYYSWQKGLIRTNLLNNTSSRTISVIDETANWKTYEGYLYSFRYPANLYLKNTTPGSSDLKSADNLSLYTDQSYNNKIIDFSLINNDIYTSKDVILGYHGYPGPDGGYIKGEDISNILVDNRKAISGIQISSSFLQNSQESREYKILIPIDNGYRTLVVSSSEENKNQVSQILTTFKFATPLSELDQFDVLPLYHGINWDNVIASEQKLSNPGLFCEKEDELISVHLPGNEMITNDKLPYNLEEHVTEILISLGWDTTVPSFAISNMQCSTISAVGPNGNTLGFYLVRNKKIRVINIRGNRVFVSHILSEQELVNLINE